MSTSKANSTQNLPFPSKVEGISETARAYGTTDALITEFLIALSVLNVKFSYPLSLIFLQAYTTQGLVHARDFLNLFLGCCSCVS